MKATKFICGFFVFFNLSRILSFRRESQQFRLQYLIRIDFTSNSNNNSRSIGSLHNQNPQVKLLSNR